MLILPYTESEHMSHSACPESKPLDWYVEVCVCVLYVASYSLILVSTPQLFAHSV